MQPFYRRYRNDISRLDETSVRRRLALQRAEDQKMGSTALQAKTSLSHAESCATSQTTFALYATLEPERAHRSLQRNDPRKQGQEYWP
jgi:hypothetical protein